MIKLFKGSGYIEKYGKDCFGLDIKGNTTICYSPENITSKLYYLPVCLQIQKRITHERKIGL